jgi:adenosine deaminase/adenosine deaminase CECR1
MAGVNIVSPEDGETSMKDYWLHMVMFKYCHSRFPNVKYTLHAGELTLGLVQPEDLTWHINAAVHIAGANRIGHGVDIAYEQNSYDLLQYMAKKDIPIEINLVSNEFILKVKENRHPLMLYKEFGVPIVISTDDAGILRTNMTEQYVLLAKRYKDITYSDIKQFVYNSINYSFIQDNSVKKQLLINLDSRFKTFESHFPKKNK